MRYQRLIIESGSNAVTVRFHPRLTVISGVGNLERESLVSELMGAFDGSRRDVHMEVQQDHGRRLAFLRGKDGESDHVLDINVHKDVTSEFTSPLGKIDLAWKLGIRVKALEEKVLISNRDVATMSKTDETLTQLAALDQDELWDAAERLKAANLQMEEESRRVGVTRQDAKLIDEIEKRHEAFESALLNHEIARHYSIFVGGSFALGAIPAGLMVRYAGLAFLAVAAITTLVSIKTRRRMEHARKSEHLALAAAGAQSYMGFYVQRVSGILKDEQVREQITAAAHEHNEATKQWQAIVGEFPVEFALKNKNEIEAVAKKMEIHRSQGFDYAADFVAHDVDPAELAQALIVRMSELRKVGHGGESLPLILDEPLLGVETATKIWVLDLIARSAGSIQIIYMTQDPEVISWARKQCVNGNSAMIEPAPKHQPTKAHLSIVA